MIAIVATMRVQDGKGEAFEAIFADLSAKVRANEPGCVLYQLTRSRKDPGAYKVLELYKDQAAIENHSQTDYFKAAGAQMGPVLAERAQIEILDAV